MIRQSLRQACFFMIGLFCCNASLYAGFFESLSSILNGGFKVAIGGAIAANNAKEVLNSANATMATAQSSGFIDQIKAAADDVLTGQRQAWVDAMTAAQNNAQSFANNQTQAMTGAMTGATTAFNAQGTQLNQNLSAMNTTAQQQADLTRTTASSMGSSLNNTIAQQGQQMSAAINTAGTGVSGAINDTGARVDTAIANQTAASTQSWNQMTSAVTSAGNNLNNTIQQQGTVLSDGMSTAITTQGNQLNQTGVDLTAAVNNQGQLANNTLAATGTAMTSTVQNTANNINQTGVDLTAAVNNQGQLVNNTLAATGTAMTTTTNDVLNNANTQVQASVSDFGVAAMQAALLPAAASVDAAAYAAMFSIAPTTPELTFYSNQLLTGYLAATIVANNSSVMVGISRDMGVLAGNLKTAKDTTVAAMQTDGFLKLSQAEMQQFTQDKQAALTAATQNIADGVPTSAARLMAELDHVYYEKYRLPETLASIATAKRTFAQNITPVVQGIILQMSPANFLAFTNAYQAATGNTIKGIVTGANGQAQTAVNAVLNMGAAANANMQSMATQIQTTAQQAAANTQAAVQNAASTTAATTVAAHQQAVADVQAEMARQEEPDRGNMGVSTTVQTTGMATNGTATTRTVVARR